MQAIYKETVQQLAEIYGEAEAQSITNLLFEDYLNIPRTSRLTMPDQPYSDDLHQKHSDAVQKLLNHQPVQQIIGHCFFYGHQFDINEHVLIPRPETEELVDLVVRENNSGNFRVLDVGTGTGCIAISLASALHGSDVYAWDISEQALSLARQNAAKNQVKVHFRREDVLTYDGDENFDIIVSNPPYIPITEKGAMAKNVTHYEPEMALFVPDDDPLLFYRKIGGMGKKTLSPDGKLYFEVHENYAHQVQDLMKKLAYKKVTIIKDLQGKDRIVTADK